MRAALVQLTSSDDPVANLPILQGYIADAAKAGATFILTPEVTNCVSASRTHQRAVLQDQANDITLSAIRTQARDLGVWVLFGSLALSGETTDGRFVNRSFLIAPDGTINAQYDKIHMFDVTINDTETYRESSGYRPGEMAVLADTPIGQIGMTICYDIRFPALYRDLAQQGAQIITVPSAFSPVTGAAHWETLLRSRAIETGCFILAPAQCGQHAATRGKPRKTWGHSLAVAPWGEVLADGGDAPGITMVDFDLQEVEAARRRIPSLTHDRPFEGP